MYTESVRERGVEDICAVQAVTSGNLERSGW